LFLAINVLGKVRDHLASIVANGKLAEAELRELARLRSGEAVRYLVRTHKMLNATEEEVS
jgi:hypothetical protein